MAAWTMTVAMRVVRSDWIVDIFLSSADISWQWTEKMLVRKREKLRMFPKFCLSDSNDGIALLLW